MPIGHALRYCRSGLERVIKRGAAALLGRVIRVRVWLQPASLPVAPAGFAVVIDRCLGIGDLLMISPAIRLLQAQGPVTVIAHLPRLLDADLAWQRTGSWTGHRRAVTDLTTTGRLVLIPFAGLRGLITLAWWPGALPPGIVVLDAGTWLDTTTGATGAVTGHHYSDPPIAAAGALLARGAIATRGTVPALPNPSPAGGEGLCARLPPVTAPAEAQSRCPRQPYLVIAPWATAATRRWPLAHWAALIEQLAVARPELAVVLVGSAAERSHGDQIAGLTKMPVVNLIGSLSLAGTSAAIAAARLLICCDNGPMHLGIGVGVPVLAVFGSTDPAARLAGDRAEAIADPGLCPRRLAPCYAGFQREPRCPTGIECLTALTPERVAARALRCLDTAERGS